MKKIFKGHLPWGFLGFRNANAENREWHRYLTGYIPVKKIHKAASMGDITQVQRMLEFGDVDVNVTDRKKRTALHYACAHGQAEMAALLLWYECNIEARDSDGSTALIKAAQRQHEECVKVLLENGADSNAIDAHQNTALHYAVYNNSTSIAAKLLEFRADTEIKAKNGYTPLILAVLENKLEMVALLLRAAANINALDNYKRSALIHAVRAQSRDMISFLLQQGADASLVDVYGATAQSYTVFETFQVLSKGPSSTTREDRYNSDAKEDCLSCAQFTQDGERMAQSPAREEGNRGAADKLGSQVTLENQEEELEPCEDCNSKADTCPACYSKASLTPTPRTSKPTAEEDENNVSSKTPVVPSSPELTESDFMIGYPKDWPEPVKFFRQPAFCDPIGWRKDMESRSVPLDKNKQPLVVSSGNEANVQTHEQPARVFEDPDAKDSGPTEEEDAKTPVVPSSPELTESDFMIGYPKDWPEPVKFFRQPAFCDPIGWRKDMESRSVPLDKNKQPLVVSSGNEANVQTHEQPARVFEDPDAKDSGPTEEEDAKTPVVPSSPELTESDFMIGYPKDWPEPVKFFRQPAFCDPIGWRKDMESRSVPLDKNKQPLVVSSGNEANVQTHEQPARVFEDPDAKDSGPTEEEDAKTPVVPSSPELTESDFMIGYPKDWPEPVKFFRQPAFCDPIGWRKDMESRSVPLDKNKQPLVVSSGNEANVQTHEQPARVFEDPDAKDSGPTEEEDAKTPVVPSSPELTESDFMIGYPKDWPEPVKFFRQPAFCDPIGWRKDMESRSVPLDKNKQPLVVSSGNEANVQTHEQPARVFEDPDAKDSGPTEEEDAKTPVVPSSPVLTESDFLIGYPKDWPEPMKFFRQPAVYKPIEWRKDMESRSVPLDKNKQPLVVSSGNEANVQTHEQPARVFEEPDANDSDPTEEEDAKTPVVPSSPVLTESDFLIGYPKDWPEPMKFFRQPAVYKPIEWRKDMESRSVPLDKNKQPLVVCSGNEANVQTHKQPARVFEDPDANDSDPTEEEDAKDELVSLIAPLEENKPQIKEFSVTEAVKPERKRQDALEYEEKRLESCQESILESAESTESYSILRLPTKRDPSDPATTAGKKGCGFQTKHKDKLEKHPLAQRASQRQVKQRSSPPLQLHEQDQEPEGSTVSDGEDGYSRSAKGQVLRGVSIEGDRLEGEDTGQLATNKLSQKVGEIREAVKITDHHEEEQPRDDSTGKTSLKSATPKLAWDMLGCEVRDTAAALAAVTLQTYPRQKEGGLRNIFPSPSFSQVLEHSGQSVTKSPLMKHKLDHESNKSEIEESLHESKEKSSKTTESGKSRGQCPEACMGGKPDGCEFKSQLQKTLRPKRMVWQLDGRHMSKSSDSKRLSESTEESHTSEFNSWSDSTFCDTHKKSKGTPDLTQKPLHSNCEAPARTARTANAAPPGGRTASALAGEDPRDRLSDSEFQILEEEILAWEKVNLENESVSENLPNKCEGISSDAMGQRGNYLEDEHSGAESDSKETTQSEQKSLDGTEKTQLQKMSEEPEINKKSDGECAPVHPEVPAVKAHEKASITRDLTGNNGEPDKHSCEVEDLSKKQPSLELEVPETLCLMVTDCSDYGLIVRRKGGRTEKLLPTEEKDELAKSVSGSCMKEIKKTGRETRTPRQPVITPVFEKSLPEAAGLLPVKEGHHLSEMGRDEGRLTKRQAKEKHKMETQVNQVNEMKAANSRSQPSETAAGNDSGSLLTLWDMIHSYERLMELKNSRCEVLTRKLENMESRASGVQREQMEIESCLPHRGEREDLCTLRFPLKPGEKQEHAESMFQQKKMQPSRREEQRSENVEQTQYPEIGKMIADAKAIENNLRQLQGLQDQLSETAQSSGKMHASLQRLEIRLSKLKITLRELTAKLEQIQNQLLHEGLLGDETKKLVQQTQSLECALERQTDKSQELMTELTGFKKLFEETKKELNKHEGRRLSGPGDLKTSQFDMHLPISTLRHELCKLRETWETTYYKYLHTVVKLQFMEQELAAIKTEQKKCGHLLFESHKNLEEEVLHCRSWMREHEIQARDQNKTKDLRDADEVVTIGEMELRIKTLEFQLESTRGAQRSLREGDSEHPAPLCWRAGPAVTQPLLRELGKQASRSPRK